jgi:hypothetical protein
LSIKHQAITKPANPNFSKQLAFCAIVMAVTSDSHTVSANDLTLGQRLRQFNKMLVFIMV